MTPRPWRSFWTGLLTRAGRSTASRSTGSTPGRLSRRPRKRHGVEVQVSRRDPDAKGFSPLPVRWRIEATFGTLTNRYRRLTRNLEQDGVAAEDAVAIANFHRVLRAYARGQSVMM